jgi:hypothetical protein
MNNIETTSVYLPVPANVIPSFRMTAARPGETTAFLRSRRD